VKYPTATLLCHH